MTKKRIALRMDDVFASTKKFEIYGKDVIRFAGRLWPVTRISNFLWMKYCPGLRDRLPYRELRVREWEQMIDLLLEYKAKLTVGVTAAWVNHAGEPVPFFQKFPAEAAVLKQGVDRGVLEIANHGLTHCVVGRHRPQPFGSNRLAHREFWDWLPAETHRTHLRISQQYFKDYFGCNAVTFIPPGNVWTAETERFAYEAGLRYLSSTEAMAPTATMSNGLLYVGDAQVVLFHDWDIVRKGVEGLRTILQAHADREIVFVRELLSSGSSSAPIRSGQRAQERTLC